MAIYLLVTSVFRSGFEKSVGAVELVSFGPADGTSHALAALVRDVALTAVALTFIAAFLWISSLVHNTVLGPSFFPYLILLFLMSIALYCYGLLASAAADGAAGALVLFATALLLFAVIHSASFAIIEGYVASLTSVFAWVVQWFSPRFYFALGVDAADYGNVLLYLATLGLLLLLAAAIFATTHLTLRIRGVRP